jgi:hypothetical protein
MISLDVSKLEINNSSLCGCGERAILRIVIIITIISHTIHLIGEFSLLQRATTAGGWLLFDKGVMMLMTACLLLAVFSLASTTSYNYY